MPWASERFVVLSPGARGGLAVPIEPLRSLVDLEARGFMLAPAGEALVVRPASQLTDDDRSAIRRWKPHLLALLAYEPPCRDDANV